MMSVMPLHVNNAKLSHLWRQDILQNLYPGCKGNRQELQMAAEEHFNRSVKIDTEGSYVVSLPWIKGHHPLPTCRNVAERRLNSCIDPLKMSLNLAAYKEVFRE